MLTMTVERFCTKTQSYDIKQRKFWLVGELNRGLTVTFAWALTQTITWLLIRCGLKLTDSTLHGADLSCYLAPNLIWPHYLFRVFAVASSNCVYAARGLYMCLAHKNGRCLSKLTVGTACRHASIATPMKNGSKHDALFNIHTCHTRDSLQHNISQLLSLQLLASLIQMLMNERWHGNKFPPWWFERERSWMLLTY